MRLLTKDEACRELRLSLSTLNRCQRRRGGPVRREPQGRRHRVYVMLDDDLPEDSRSDDSALAVAQERIRGLEEHVDVLQRQLELEQRRKAELVNDLRVAREQCGPWWQ